MRFQQSKCKFCGEPITLSLPDDPNDPVYGLACLAACNRCADRRGGRPIEAQSPSKPAPQQTSLPYRDANEDDSRTV